MSCWGLKNPMMCFKQQLKLQHHMSPWICWGHETQRAPRAEVFPSGGSGGKNIHGRPCRLPKGDFSKKNGDFISKKSCIMGYFMWYFVGICKETPTFWNGDVDICWRECWLHAMLNGIEFAASKNGWTCWNDDLMGNLWGYTATKQLLVITYGQQGNRRKTWYKNREYHRSNWVTFPAVLEYRGPQKV